MKNSETHARLPGITMLASAVILVGMLLDGGAAPAQTKPAAAKRPPNVLWLIGENIALDLGCYGEKLVRTPHLDRLAAEGVRYTHAYCTAPVCSASRSALMTGMYQTTIGAHNARSHRNDGFRLPAGVRLLTHRLRDAGYFTANVKTIEGKEVGTGKVDLNFTWDGKLFDSEAWAELKGHQPFYAQVNSLEVEYDIYDRKSAGKTRVEWVGEKEHPKIATPDNVTPPPYYPDHPIARQEWSRYLNSVSGMDRRIGIVLDKLRTDGLLENTVVIFFADNGRLEPRGIHWCYDSGLHVPMIIRWPKNYPAPPQYRPGTVCDQVLSLLDLTATTLSIAGIAKPKGMQSQIFLGPEAEPARKYAFAARDRIDETVQRIRSVHDGRFHYIRNFMPDHPFTALNRYKEKCFLVMPLMRQLYAEGKLDDVQAALMAPRLPEEELYDIKEDPHEIKNLAKSSDAKYQTMLKRMRGELKKWLRETRDQGDKLEPAEVVQPFGKEMHEWFGTPEWARCKNLPAVQDQEAKTQQRPNVLFIVIDDLNDWVGFLGGHPQVKTPNMDRLAKRGMVFANAHCAAPLCCPSRAAVFSGQQPFHTGIYDNQDNILKLRQRPILLEEYFKSRGYRTFGTGKLLHQNDHRLYDEHFAAEQRWSPFAKEQAEYTEDELPSKATDRPRHVIEKGPDGKRIVLPLNGMPSDRAPRDRGGESFDWGLVDVLDGEMGDGKIAGWAVERLSRSHDKPFFLAVGFYRPHIPLFAPKKYFDLYPVESIVLPQTSKSELGGLNETARRLALAPVTAGAHSTVVKHHQWKPAVAAYLACVSFVDAQVGRLLDALDRSPSAGNTAIVLWGDHGWHLGEKEHWGKWTGWERATRVPLVIAPAQTDRDRFKIGQVCRQPVSLIDLYPTLLDLCRLPAKPELDGASLVPQLQDPTVATRPALITFGKGNYAVRDERWRFIHYADGSEELYDHRRDPHEWKNLAADRTVAPLRARLAKLLPSPKIKSVPAKQ